MKTLLIGWFDEEGIKAKFNIKDDDLYIISDKARRMIYKAKKTKNVYYINNVEDLEEYKRVLGEIEMKFDKVIMNPPYEKNLHLKVVEEVMKYLDEDGEVVNLSPVRCLQDPFAKNKRSSDYNRFKETVFKHIKSVDVYKSSDMTRLFSGATFGMDVALYKLNKNGGYDFDSLSRFTPLLQKIFDKIIEDDTYNKMNNVVKYNNKLKNYVAINSFNANVKYGRKCFYGLKEYCGYFVNGKNANGLNYAKAKMLDPHASRGDSKNTICIKFNTAEEVKNCWDAFHTTFAKYVCMNSVIDVHIYQQYLPWMQDYTQPWTNERFYKYFNITKEEQKIIEETMKEYE